MFEGGLTIDSFTGKYVWNFLREYKRITLYEARKAVGPIGLDAFDEVLSLKGVTGLPLCMKYDSDFEEVEQSEGYKARNWEQAKKFF